MPKSKVEPLSGRVSVSALFLIAVAACGDVLASSATSTSADLTSDVGFAKPVAVRRGASVRNIERGTEVTKRKGGADDSVAARSGRFTVTEREIKLFLFPKHAAGTNEGTEAQINETRRLAANSLLRLKAVETSSMYARATPEEREWLDLSARIARAGALLDLEEIRALSRLNSDLKTLRERAYERYLARPSHFQAPGYAEVSVLMIDPRVDFDGAVWALTDAREAIARGEDFDVVATRHTIAKNDDGSPRVRITTTFQETDPMIRRWVFVDAKPGDVLGPFLSANFFTIVKFHRREPATSIPFEQVEGRLIEEIRKETGQTARALASDRLLPEPVVLEKSDQGRSKP